MMTGRPTNARASAQFYQVIIEDDLTLIENVHVALMFDRGNPGFVIFLPAYRSTLYFSSNERITHLVAQAPREERLTVMKAILEEYNGPRVVNEGTILAFCIYLLRFTDSMSFLPGVINVRNLRLGLE